MSNDHAAADEIMWADLVRFENLCLSIGLPHPTLGLARHGPWTKTASLYHPILSVIVLPHGSGRKRMEHAQAWQTVLSMRKRSIEILSLVASYEKDFTNKDEHEKNHKIKSRSTCEISWMTICLMCTTGTTTFSSMFSNTSFILNCYFMPAGLDWLVDVCRIERGWRIFSKIKLDRSKDCRMIKEEK